MSRSSGLSSPYLQSSTFCRSSNKKCVSVPAGAKLTWAQAFAQWDHWWSSMIVVSCRGSGGSQGSLYIGFGWFWFAIGHGQSDSVTISNLSSYHSRLVSSPPLRLENSGLPKILIWSIKKWNDWFYPTVLEGKASTKSFVLQSVIFPRSSQDTFVWLTLLEWACMLFYARPWSWFSSSLCCLSAQGSFRKLKSSALECSTCGRLEMFGRVLNIDVNSACSKFWILDDACILEVIHTLWFIHSPQEIPCQGAVQISC